jgi:endogenous inhibitor of DNA gyrase (YacG/DUF329 family)
MPRKPAASPPPASAAGSQTRTVRCPACGGPSLYGLANSWRPFCSKRCKLQDLGDWASERFRVEVREPDGSDADPAADNGNPGPLAH